MATKAKKDTGKVVAVIALLIGAGLLMSRSGKGKGSMTSNFYDLGDMTHSDTASAENIEEQFKHPGDQNVANANYLTKHLLDPLAYHTKKKLPIDSWWRSIKLNNRVGGEDDSFHLTAEAIDTKSGFDYRPQLKMLYEARLPFTELILYGSKTNPSRIHLGLVKGRGAEREVLYKTSSGYQTLTVNDLKNLFT